MNEINYKELLKKYMLLVIESEGIDFINNIGYYTCGKSITKDEEVILKKISKDIFDQE